jgi:hypothetical protein
VNAVVAEQLLFEEGRKNLCACPWQLKLLGLEGMATVTLMMTHTSITDERYPAFGRNAAAVLPGFPASPPPPSVAAIENKNKKLDAHESGNKKKIKIKEK